MRNAIKIHSLDNSNKNRESQASMAKSLEHATAARTVLGSSLGHSLLFDQNLVFSCQGIEKFEPLL